MSIQITPSSDNLDRQWLAYYTIKRDLSIERLKHATTVAEQTRQTKFVTVYNNIIKRYQ
jgi:hypothetical protein